VPFNVFAVDILDSSLNTLGAGPLYNVESVEVTEELDRAGKVVVTVPIDQRAIDLVAEENRMRVRTENGALVTGIIQDINLTVQGGKPMWKLRGADLLGELVFLNTGYNREYDNLNTASAIIGTTGTATSLLGGTSWTQGTVSPSAYTTTSIIFNAQTILQALVTLAQQIGDHFRQGTTEQTLDWGAFGVASGVRVTNVHAVSIEQYDALDHLAYISSLSIGTISGDVENKLFPLGRNKFDMRDATATSANIKVQANAGPTGATTTVASAVTAGDATMTVASATGFIEQKEVWIGDASDWTQTHEIAIVTNITGAVLTLLGGAESSYSIGADVIQAPQFYIEDLASQGDFGVREACPQFGWIGPGENTADVTLQQQAADTLYAAANARLTRYGDSYKDYRLPIVVNFPETVRVGQTVRLVYRGAVYGFGGTFYEEIDDDFFVIKITRRYTKQGQQTAALTVANVSRPTPNNASIVIFNLDTLSWMGLNRGSGV
jgi:hypothetical protein